MGRRSITRERRTKYLGYAGAVHVADGRGRGDRGADAGAGGERLSSGGHGCGWAGGSAGADAGLLHVSRCEGSRVLLNLGGIANLTALPAGARVEDVMAFDTGPGNMVIDACMQRLFGRGFDRNGASGGAGRVLEEVVDEDFAGAILLCPAAEVVRAGGVW